MKLKAIENVYSYYFPETRKIIDEITKKFPHDTFLGSIDPGLDKFHLPTIKKYVNNYSDYLPALKYFENAYVTSGASEGIFHILVWIKKKKPDTKIYYLSGEYSGYKKYATEIGLKCEEIDPEKQRIEKLEKGIWFISNPSARDGNIISNNFINKICDLGHEVVFDATYIGLTRKNEFDISHSNIIAVIVSFSKPFGLYYHRIGLTFSRKKIKTLEANIWFKNIFSLMIVDRILSTFRPEYFYNKYSPIQKKIINSLNKEFNLNLKRSDVFLLAYLDSGNIEKLERFRRGKKYRLCLTPYFLEKVTG